MPFNMPGMGEWIIILVILLVIFGPKRLPELGRSLGKGIKEFKKSTNELTEQLTAEEPKKTTAETAEKEEAAKKPAENAESKTSETKTT
ncbi:MAG: twin-arginine translocase TatA/TatE family subunit [Thermoleophilia bacterium]